jgi:metal-responsive CopG/Arc/MetJ family transcriptional regulator
MAPRREKIAISLDSTLLERIERLRAVTGETRSAVIGRALLKLTHEELHAARIRRYVEAYRETPEQEQSVKTARKMARAALARLPWDDE